MEFQANNNQTSAHHPLRFVFAFIAAIILIVISFFLYKAYPSKTEQPDLDFSGISEQQKVFSALPESKPATEAEQKEIFDALQKISTQNKNQTEAEASADAQAKMNALPASSTSSAAAQSSQ